MLSVSGSCIAFPCSPRERGAASAAWYVSTVSTSWCCREAGDLIKWFCPKPQIKGRAEMQIVIHMGFHIQVVINGVLTLMGTEWNENKESKKMSCARMNSQGPQSWGCERLQNHRSANWPPLFWLCRTTWTATLAHGWQSTWPLSRITAWKHSTFAQSCGD